MKRALAIFAFLPFVSFGYTVDEIRSRVRGAYIFSWDDNWSWKSRNFGGHYDDVLVAFKTCTIGLECSSSYLTYPDIDDVNYLGTNSFSSANVTRPVYDLSDKYYRVSTFAELPPIFKFAQALYANGYDGAGFVSINRSSSSAKINFNYSLAVADIASSTNLVFQRLLLSHLQSINNNILSISSGVSQLVPVVESVRDVNVNILSNSVSIVSNTLDIIDALIGDYPDEEPTRGTKGGAKGPYNDVRTSIKSQLQAWRNQATTQLQTWKTDLADQLEAWKTSDETGYLNIRRGISNVVNQLETTAPNSTNKVPYTAYVTNYVTRVITNEIERSSKEISTNVAQAARQTRDFLRDNLIDPLFDANSPGINVNIRAPLWGQSQSAVHVHDSALDTFGISVGASLDDINQWLGDIYSQGGDANDNWQAWFDRWDGFSEFTVGWFTDWWDLLADNMDSFYSAFYTADGTRRMMLELISNPEFRADVYQGLNWFQRVEYLLGFIANVSTGTVEVADIEDDMDDQVSAFENVGTNLVSASSRVVDLFDYVTRFSTSLKNAFQSSSAPVTDGIVLLQGDTWFTSDQPLVLRVDINVQNACRLGAQCIWYCGAFVAIWLVVSWAWGKILAVCRWLWSLFDI